jgi:hypothetical protein
MQNNFNFSLMKLLQVLTVLIVAGTFSSCAGAFKSKRGCPTNDRAMGAERVMAGEGKKKPSKFKIKNM